MINFHNITYLVEKYTKRLQQICRPSLNASVYPHAVPPDGVSYPRKFYFLVNGIAIIIYFTSLPSGLKSLIDTCLFKFCAARA